MKRALTLMLAILVFLTIASLGLAEAEDSMRSEEQAESFPIGLPDMQTEAGIREYLTGEWNFYDHAFLGYNACRMIIDKDMNVELEFFDSQTYGPKGKYGGQFTFDRIFAAAHEAPDLLCLELTDGSTMLGGDFFFIHRTIYDGLRVMSLFSAGNGGCVFDLLDPSDEDGWGECPVEMLFIKDTGEENDLAPRRDAEFYAVYWGGYEHVSIWLDDIDWPPSGDYDPEEIGSDSWYRYLTTRYDNEVPFSVAYVLAEDLMQTLGGELLVGTVYAVKTDEHGEIISMRTAHTGVMASDKKQTEADNLPYIGLWHASPVVGSGFSARLALNADHTFLWLTSQMDGLERVRARSGTWAAENDVLRLTTEEEVCWIGGREEPADGSWGTDKVIVDAETVVNKPAEPQTEEYELGLVTTDAEVLDKRMVTIGGVQYWELAHPLDVEQLYSDYADYKN